MKLMPNGQYGIATPLGDIVNIDIDDEAKPILALGGRLLLYTSDSNNGLGGTDMFSASLSSPHEWSGISEPVNLGIPLNTPDDDEGVTYFSEYTGLAYLHRTNPCNGDKDLFAFQLGPGVFPPNAMRLAGLVIDENGDPIGGGFMEFTPDYQLKVHAETITAEGTYNYTVADSTAVVRLFPEIPGYYSERDTTHFLANITKGQILRDTFQLTSFDYIRRNFRLVNSTFVNGTAQFDQPAKAYPELNRLAKIAVRMGAEIQLNGHTDAVGTEAENLRLSIDRAKSVEQFLVSRCGFDPDKIHLAGYGATQPRCKENTETCRNLNRRIEVIFKMPVLPGQPRINN
jgi:outer membrane protein OmpA-like peptidoglycan-associated protein